VRWGLRCRRAEYEGSAGVEFSPYLDGLDAYDGSGGHVLSSAGHGRLPHYSDEYSRPLQHLYATLDADSGDAGRHHAAGVTDFSSPHDEGDDGPHGRSDASWGSRRGDGYPQDSHDANGEHYDDASWYGLGGGAGGGSAGGGGFSSAGDESGAGSGGSGSAGKPPQTGSGMDGSGGGGGGGSSASGHGSSSATGGATSGSGGSGGGGGAGRSARPAPALGTSKHGGHAGPPVPAPPVRNVPSAILATSAAHRREVAEAHAALTRTRDSEARLAAKLADATKRLREAQRSVDASSRDRANALRRVEALEVRVADYEVQVQRMVKAASRHRGGSGGGDSEVLAIARDSDAQRLAGVEAALAAVSQQRDAAQGSLRAESAALEEARGYIAVLLAAVEGRGLVRDSSLLAAAASLVAHHGPHHGAAAAAAAQQQQQAAGAAAGRGGADAAMAAELQRLRAELEARSKDSATREYASERLEQQLQELHGRYDRVVARLSDLQHSGGTVGRVAQLQTEQEALMGYIQERKVELDDARAAASAAADTIAGLQRANAALQQNLTSECEARNDALAAERAVRRERDDALATVAGLEQALAALRDSKALLDAKLAEQDSEAKELNAVQVRWGRGGELGSGGGAGKRTGSSGWGVRWTGECGALPWPCLCVLFLALGSSTPPLLLPLPLGASRLPLPSMLTPLSLALLSLLPRTPLPRTPLPRTRGPGFFAD
jgi:hypothetical protein